MSHKSGTITFRDPKHPWNAYKTSRAHFEKRVKKINNANLRQTVRNSGYTVTRQTPRASLIKICLAEFDTTYEKNWISQMGFPFFKVVRRPRLLNFCLRAFWIYRKFRSLGRKVSAK